MTIRTIALHVDPIFGSRLERIHSAWSGRHADRTSDRRTVEYMLYEEIFRSVAKEYREDLAHFELGKGSSRMGEDGGRRRRDVPIRANDPTSPKREVYLTPGMVDWDSQRAKRVPEEGDIPVRFPADALDRLERGLALQEAWSHQYPEGSAVKVYSSFEEWAEEQVAAYVQREYDRLQDQEIEQEENELYPGLNEKKVSEPAKVTRQVSSEELMAGQAAKVKPPARGVLPHRPYARGPTSR